MKKEFKSAELLYLMRRISHNFTIELELNLKEKEISGTQVYFMVYILRHHPTGTYLTELCHEIGVSKPTLSALIKKMKEKGYLYFQENPEDIRKKKVLPTDKLLNEGKEFMKKASQLETEACSVLNPSERVQLRDLEQKLLEQLAGMKQKETTNRRLC